MTLVDALYEGRVALHLAAEAPLRELTLTPTLTLTLTLT